MLRTVVWFVMVTLTSALGSCTSEKPEPESCNAFNRQCLGEEDCPGGSVCETYPYDGCRYCFALPDAAVDGAATDASAR